MGADDLAVDPNTLGTAEAASSDTVDSQDPPVAAPTPAVTSATCRAPNAGDSRPGTTDAAGAVAAAERVQLESLVTMGDGTHDSFTCHCWGLESTLWAVNEPGQLVRTGVQRPQSLSVFVRAVFFSANDAPFCRILSITNHAISLAANCRG